MDFRVDCRIKERESDKERPGKRINGGGKNQDKIIMHANTAASPNELGKQICRHQSLYCRQHMTVVSFVL